MGKCVYCGESAGPFRNKHSKCELLHLEQEKIIRDKQMEQENIIQEGKQRIVNSVSSTIQTSDNYDELEMIISEIEQSHFVPLSERKDLLIKGWEISVEKMLEDRILDETEEKRLTDFTKRFSLSENDINRSGAFTKIVKAAVLRDVLNGKIPKRIKHQESLLINFKMGEQVVWYFRDVQYIEDKTLREYVGGSMGIGIRLMKGVYYRVGAFKGHAVEHTERIQVDTGLLVITNLNIYFKGSLKSFRIPHTNIVSFESFTDGIGVMRDVANAKWQIFVTGDGWFIYNLLANIPNATFQDSIAISERKPSKMKPFNPLK